MWLAGGTSNKSREAPSFLVVPAVASAIPWPELAGMLRAGRMLHRLISRGVSVRAILAVLFDQLLRCGFIHYSGISS